MSYIFDAGAEAHEARRFEVFRFTLPMLSMSMQALL